MSELVSYLPDVFRLLGEIRARRMFGGHGIYLDELFFAIVQDEVLYLKADAQTAPQFRALGLAPFEYVKDGRVAQLGYYAAPAEVLDDAEAARDWGRLAVDAALRAVQRGAHGKSRPD
jgi:DNA transformation protein